MEWWTALSQALAGVRRCATACGHPRQKILVRCANRAVRVQPIDAPQTFQDNTISVRQYLKGRFNGAYALEQLCESRKEIEKEIGAVLEWDPES